jgi:hypothetical protein
MSPARAISQLQTFVHHKICKIQSILFFGPSKIKLDFSSSTPLNSLKSIKTHMESLSGPTLMKFKELLLTWPSLGMLPLGPFRIFPKTLSKIHLGSALYIPVKTISKLSLTNRSSMKGL